MVDIPAKFINLRRIRFYSEVNPSALRHKPNITVTNQVDHFFCTVKIFVLPNLPDVPMVYLSVCGGCIPPVLPTEIQHFPIGKQIPGYIVVLGSSKM